jgi:hypothetical protein
LWQRRLMQGFKYSNTIVLSLKLTDTQVLELFLTLLDLVLAPLITYHQDLVVHFWPVRWVWVLSVTLIWRTRWQTGLSAAVAFYSYRQISGSTKEINTVNRNDILGSFPNVLHNKIIT